MNSTVLKFLIFPILAICAENVFCNPKIQDNGGTETVNESSSIGRSGVISCTDAGASGYIENSSTQVELKGEIQARIAVSWGDHQQTFDLFMKEGQLTPESERTLTFSIKSYAGRCGLKVTGLSKISSNQENGVSVWGIPLVDSNDNDISIGEGDKFDLNKMLPIALVLSKGSDEHVITDEITSLDFTDDISGEWNLLIEPDLNNTNQKKGNYKGNINLELVAIE